MLTEMKLKLIQDDPWLEPYEVDINERYSRFVQKNEEIKLHSKSLSQFANGHLYFGFQYDNGKKGWYYREWAPAAYALFLIGDFNNWDAGLHPLKKINSEGCWEIFVPVGFFFFFC